MKMRAPAIFRPSEASIQWATVIQRADAAHRALCTIAADAVGLDIDRLKHRTPVSFLVRVSLAQALHLQAIHVARHVAQAERVIELRTKIVANPMVAE